MFDATLNRIAAFAVRHERILNALAIGWFVFSCAATARFLPLPDIPYLTDRNAWMIAGPYNAIWWGLLRPQIVKRTEAIKAKDAPAAIESDES